MLGITRKHLEPIHGMANILYPDFDIEKMGDWGILYLCCGAFAGANDVWLDIIRNSDTFVCPSDVPKVMLGSSVCTSDEYAQKFSAKIKEWCASDYAVSLAEERMASLKSGISDETFLHTVKYLTLAIMINSSKMLTKEDLLGFDSQTWTSLTSFQEHRFGWPELFFAAGLLLRKEKDVDWQKMATTILGMDKPLKNDVVALFEHYSGKNIFSNAVSTKIRADQLKKGSRIKMRNGWEAIVVEKCDGNTLVAKVFGDFTETGSIYAHNIVAAEIDGVWVEVAMTQDQARFGNSVAQILGG